MEKGLLRAGLGSLVLAVDFDPLLLVKPDVSPPRVEGAGGSAEPAVFAVHVIELRVRRQLTPLFSEESCT